MSKLFISLVILASMILFAGIPGFASENEYERGEKASEAFDKLDTNGDVQLSLDEYTARYVKRFNALDQNGDGYLTKEEYQETATEAAEKVKEVAPEIEEQVRSKAQERREKRQQQLNQ